MPEELEGLASEENEENPEDNEESNEEEGQESISLFGNEYSRDDDGIAKLTADAKNWETAYHTNRRELAEAKETLGNGQSREAENSEGEEENQFPFDTEGMEEEDKRAAQALQSYIKSEIQSGIEEGLEPIRDRELDQDIQSELNEIEATHGKINQDELIRFARDNGLESNLVHAHKVMTYDDQIQKGRQQEQSDRKRKEGAFLPSGSGTNNSKVPKYNKKEHGDKGYGELLDKNL